MKNKRYMSLTNEQHTTLLRCLVEFKNDLVRQGRTADRAYCLQEYAKRATAPSNSGSARNTTPQTCNVLL